MKISELSVGQGNVNVEAKVKSVEPERTFNKFGREIRVTNAIISDGSGEIKLTLWNTDIDKVKVGDKVKISNGYVNEFKDEKQLTTGKFGKLEILGKSKSEEPAEKEFEEEQEIDKESEEQAEEELVEE